MGLQTFLEIGEPYLGWECKRRSLVYLTDSYSQLLEQIWQISEKGYVLYLALS